MARITVSPAAVITSKPQTRPSATAHHGASTIEKSPAKTKFPASLRSNLHSLKSVWNPQTMKIARMKTLVPHAASSRIPSVGTSHESTAARIMPPGRKHFLNMGRHWTK